MNEKKTQENNLGGCQKPYKDSDFPNSAPTGQNQSPPLMFDMLLLAVWPHSIYIKLSNINKRYKILYIGVPGMYKINKTEFLGRSIVNKISIQPMDFLALGTSL